MFDDGDGFVDVYARDLQTDTTTLLSRASGANGVKGNGGSGGASLSADGRLVAFHSVASNLSADDHDASFDVFVRDGHVVAFGSSATNLSSDDDDGDGDAGRLRARPAAEHDRARKPCGRSERRQGQCLVRRGALSGDGRFLAFSSQATNPHPSDDDSQTDVFRRELGNNEPRAAPHAYAAAQDTPLTVAAPGVLANDADADGDPLSALLVSGPAHGTLALNADGSFTYSPAPAPPPLAAAPAAPAVRPLCQGRPATLVGTARRDALRGTPQPGCSAAPATTCCLAAPARTRCAAAWQGPHQRRPRPRPQSPVMSEAACATGIAGLIVPAFALLPGGAQAASNQTELVSRASGAVGSKTNSVYDMPRLSGDRR